MFYVYILASLSPNGARYVGYTKNLKKRFEAHNAGLSTYTRQCRPWRLVTYLGFENQGQARRFERYLKTASGIAFMKKRLM